MAPEVGANTLLLTAAKLAGMFVDNFKTFEDGVSADVLAAGPQA